MLPMVMPMPNTTSTSGHGGCRQPGHLGRHRRDVAVDGEQAAEADRPDGEREPHLQAREGLQLVPHRRRRVAGLPRHGERDGHEGEREDAGDDEVGDAPSVELAEPGDGRHADDVRDGQAAEHEGDAASALARAHEAGGHERGDAEVGAVRERGDEAGEQHELERRQHGRGDGAEGERREQRQQQLLARPAGCGRGDGGRTDDDAERVGGDEQAGLRVGGGRSPSAYRPGQQVAREVRQQAHGHELGASRCRSRPARERAGPDGYGPATESSARQLRGSPVHCSARIESIRLGPSPFDPVRESPTFVATGRSAHGGCDEVGRLAEAPPRARRADGRARRAARPSSRRSPSRPRGARPSR